MAAQTSPGEAVPSSKVKKYLVTVTETYRVVGADSAADAVELVRDVHGNRDADTIDFDVDALP